MKKNILYIVSFAVLLVFLGCEKEYENGMSSTSDFDGDWQVQYDYDIENFGPDAFGAGYVHNLTYNTAADDGAHIWLEDGGNFWDYKVQVPVDVNGLTFGSNDTLIDLQYGIKVLVQNGKIIKDAAVMPSGLVVDSIYYEVWFEDIYDYYGIPELNLLVGGVRNTGFSEDIR